LTTCLNPNKNNPYFCPDFEPPDQCKKEGFCDWKKGLNIKSERERFATRSIEEVGA